MSAKSRGLSVAGKGRTQILSGMGQEGERKRTPYEVSKCFDDIETEESTHLRDGTWELPVYCPGGVRHEGGASLARALDQFFGSWPATRFKLHAIVFAKW